MSITKAVAEFLIGAAIGTAAYWLRKLFRERKNGKRKDRREEV